MIEGCACVSNLVGAEWIRETNFWHAPRTTDELHEVRCCSDTEITGWKAPANACSVWGESDDTSEGWSCTSNALFSEAQDVCASVGARLCTRQELRDSCATATGCGHDRDMLWTSDEGVAGAVMWAFDLGVGTTSE